MYQRNKIILIIILLAVFLTISGLVVTKNAWLLSFDNFIINCFDNLRFPALDDFMLAVTKIGNVYESLIIFIVSSIILVAKKKKIPFY